MGHVRGLLGALVFAGLIVIALESICHERFEFLLFWPLPFFHLFLPPLDSGPNPWAGVFSLVVDAVILAALLFLISIGPQRQP